MRSYHIPKGNTEIKRHRPLTATMPPRKTTTRNHTDPPPHHRSKFSVQHETDEEFGRFACELNAELETHPDSYRKREDFERLKKRLAKKYEFTSLPTSADIYNALDDEKKKKYRPLLLKKPTRTLSGVAPVAVMTSPAPCPHGKCSYCPGGVETGSPQSYTGQEPAALRAGNHDFDPFRQVTARLTQYQTVGHATDKVDLIIMGGTFPARDVDYQESFVKGCFDAMNSFSGKGSITTGRFRPPRTRLSPTLAEAKKRNEKAPSRCIGLTIETRPDWCMEPHIDQILKLGGTRVELGVQTLSGQVLELVERGHTVEDSIKATRLLKDSGLKVCYHMMPGLPGSDYHRSLDSLTTIFRDERFMPDMLKIYPTLVMKGTKMYQLYKTASYRPLGTEQAASLIAEAKSFVPPWVRIQRIQRDIPSGLITDGVKRSDLRMLARKMMSEKGTRCRCIRCREVGLNLHNELDNDSIELHVQHYQASGGTEYFLSFEGKSLETVEETARQHEACKRKETREQRLLIAYCRLRIPSEDAHRKEIKNRNVALVRELKVFGELEELGERSENRWQHKGYGRQLLEKAEDLVRTEWQRARLLITSGVGVREYYRKAGYRMMGPYMAKRL